MGRKGIKMLFFGHFGDPNSTNHSQAEAFERAGVNVFRKDFRADRNLPDGNFDIVFISKCNEYDTQIVEKYDRAFRILWYMDPLNGNYGPSFLNKLELVDMACFALFEPWLASLELNKNCFLIEEGFDPKVDYPIKVPQNIEASFIGNLYNEERKKYHQALNFTLLKTGRKDHNIAVGQSKVNLNFTDGGTSDRAYKIMAAGGFLLSQPWAGCPFVRYRDYEVFNTIAEAKALISFYASHPEKRLEVANNGLSAVQRFSRDHWALRILERYETLKQ